MQQFNISPEAQAAVRVYDRVYQEKTTDTIQVYPDEMVVRIVRGYFKREGVRDVLDAGCGEGRNALMMAAEGLHVACLDTSEKALELTKGQAESRGLKLRMSFHQASITKVPFDDGQFDAVLCWRLVYYMPLTEARKAMEEFKRILRPGGYVYVSIPTEEYNYFADWEVREADCDLVQEMILCGNETFMRRYREDELSTLFDGLVDLEYGIQAQSFLGNPHRVQSFWHVLGRKPAGG